MRHKHHLWVLLTLAAAVSLVYLASETAQAGGLGFPLDDSWIHLQFARNLHRGEGLSYQDGELVTGSTAPLWTALLSLVFLLPGGPVLWGKALGVALYLGSVHATYLLARELGLRHGLALLAAGLFLATDWMVWSALSGMEVLLFVWLSLWGMILQVRERRRPGRPPLALALFGALTLVRPEGFVLLGLAALDKLLVVRDTGAASKSLLCVLRPAWKPWFQGLGLALVLLLPALVFYRLAGDSWLPTTFSVKTEGVRHLLPSGRDLYRILGILFRPQPLLLLVAGAGVVRLLGRLGTARDRGLLPALWLLALPLAYSTLSGPDRPLLVGNFGRYLFPLFAPLIVLGVLGLEPAVRRLSQPVRWGNVRLPVGLLLLLVLLWPSVATLANGAGRYAQNVRNVEDSDVRAAHWIRQNLPADAVLAVQDIGAIKYFAPNPIVDLTGIVNPEILPYIKGPLVGSHPSRLGGMLRFIEARGVDFLVLFPDSYPGLAGFVRSQAQEEPGLVPIHRIPVPGNITMAGSELVIFVTPWSRFHDQGSL